MTQRIVFAIQVVGRQTAQRRVEGRVYLIRRWRQHVVQVLATKFRVQRRLRHGLSGGNLLIITPRLGDGGYIDWDCEGSTLDPAHLETSMLCN